jgi:hypothetical protein
MMLLLKPNVPTVIVPEKKRNKTEMIALVKKAPSGKYGLDWWLKHVKDNW